MKLAVAVLSLACLAACSTTVSGSPADRPGTPAAATTTQPAPTTARTTRTSPTTATSRTTTRLPAPPTAIDAAADQRYCPDRITGALGKPMTVVVVETPSGRVNCDQAGAILVDYYAERRDPNPGSAPIEVAGFACNQVPEPDLPQVICTDGASLVFSMWPQGG